MKNLYFIPVCILLSALGCSSQGKTSKVILDIGGNTEAISAATGVELSKASDSTLPSDILTVDLSITDGSGGDAIFSETYSADQAGKGISLDIPSGTGRYFRVTARSSSASVNQNTGESIYYVYTGAATADLQAGIETNISIALLQQELAKSATIKLSLLNPDGSILTTLSGTKEMAGGISADVYIPTVAGNIFDGTNVAAMTTATTPITIPDLSVYPKTFQVLFVKVIASDGGVSYIGGTTIGALSEGVNNVTVKLTNASVIKLHLTESKLNTASIIMVQEVVDGATLTLIPALSPSLFTFIDGTTPAGSKTFLVPAYSGVSDYNGTYKNVRTIIVKVDGAAYLSNIYNNTTTSPLLWKSTAVPSAYTTYP